MAALVWCIGLIEDKVEVEVEILRLRLRLRLRSKDESEKEIKNRMSEIRYSSSKKKESICVVPKTFIKANNPFYLWSMKAFKNQENIVRYI